MIKRYFYPASRAHHAKCMGIDFGMVFYIPEDDMYYEEIYTADNLDMAFEANNEERVYIHPDSLSMLEPQVGDIAIDSDGGAGEYNSNRWGCFTSCGRDCEGINANLPIRIIQRNGLAFHWPEEETV